MEEWYAIETIVGGGAARLPKPEVLELFPCLAVEEVGS